MKKIITHTIILLVISNLIYGTVLLAILPKSKYSSSVGINVYESIAENYKYLDLDFNGFRKRLLISENNSSFEFSKNDFKTIIHMNGELTVRLSNGDKVEDTVYKRNVKNLYPIKVLSAIEILEEEIIVSYHYSFGGILLLLNLITLAIAFPFFKFTSIKKNV